MKKFSKIFMFAAILTLGTTTTLTSCDERMMEDFAESVNIVGTWSCSESVHSTSNPAYSKYRYNGLITFRANHSFSDSYGETGTWSIYNRKITLVYDNSFGRTVEFYVQDGYTTRRMVLKATFDAGMGRTSVCTVTLDNVNR